MRIGKWEIRRAGSEVCIPGDLQKLELRPGDVIVLKTSGKITANQVDGIKSAAESWRAAVGVDNKIIVLADGMSLDVIKPDDIVMHPTDWSKIKLGKNADGQYVFAKETIA